MRGGHILVRYQAVVASVLLVMVLGLPAGAASEAELRLDPPRGPAGTVVSVEGTQFPPAETVLLLWDDSPVLGDLLTDESGTFSSTLEIPADGNGSHTVTAQTALTSASASFQIIGPPQPTTTTTTTPTTTSTTSPTTTSTTSPTTTSTTTTTTTNPTTTSSSTTTAPPSTTEPSPTTTTPTTTSPPTTEPSTTTSPTTSPTTSTTTNPTTTTTDPTTTTSSSMTTAPPSSETTPPSEGSPTTSDRPGASTTTDGTPTPTEPGNGSSGSTVADPEGSGSSAGESPASPTTSTTSGTEEGDSTTTTGPSTTIEGTETDATAAPTGGEAALRLEGLTIEPRSAYGGDTVRIELEFNRPAPDATVRLLLGGRPLGDGTLIEDARVSMLRTLPDLPPATYELVVMIGEQVVARADLTSLGSQPDQAPATPILFFGLAAAAAGIVWRATRDAPNEISASGPIDAFYTWLMSRRRRR